MWHSSEVKAKFFGGYSHALDAKGRLTLPARFRTSFSDQCVITPSQFQDPCLVIWTVEDFNSFANAVPSESWQSEEERRVLRDWASSTYPLEIDRLGRIGLPQQLRSGANLERDVLVHGAFGTVELWDPRTWETYRSADG